MTVRRPVLLVPLVVAATLLGVPGDETPRMEFSGDSSPGGRYSLRVIPPGAPSPGGPYSLVLREKSSGAERELLRFAVHVDVSWSRDGKQLAVTDLGDGHRGKALLFDLRHGDDVGAIDLDERLQREKPETAALFHRKDVNVVARSWQPETGWIVQVNGIGSDYPRGFQRWYPFDLVKGFGEGGGGPALRAKGEKDYDAPYFEAAKAILTDRRRPTTERVLALREVMMRNARRGLAILATLFDDRDEAVRDLAAEYLAIRGDRRGLEVMRSRLDDARRAHRAVQRLGNSGRPEYAEPIARRIRAILAPWFARPWDAESRAFLKHGTIALARLGRPQDHELIFEVARVDESFRGSALSALGFVDDPRSRELLWKWHEEFTRRGFTRPRVQALLALSRLGESPAIEKLKRILRERKGWWLPNFPPLLTEERSIAFESLRPRDAATFAETVFEVAAQDPEGPGTYQAWDALGVMHPAGFGNRVLRLALSRRPHWKTVSGDRLNKVLIAIEPDLNSAFWAGLEVERVPAMNGSKTLVKQGLGALMFSGSWYWIGE